MMASDGQMNMKGQGRAPEALSACPGTGLRRGWGPSGAPPVVRASGLKSGVGSALLPPMSASLGGSDSCHRREEEAAPGRLQGRGRRRWEGSWGAVLVLALMPRPSQAEQELRVAQTEFDRQAEVTRLLLEGISSTHVSPAPVSSFCRPPSSCRPSCPHETSPY